MKTNSIKKTISITNLLLISVMLSTIISCSKQPAHKQWEYKTVEIELKTKRDIEPFLNEYGKAGWELFRIDGNFYIFKR